MADFEVHLLDPGAIEYGDCVLCLSDDKSILIDGGKKASAKTTRDTVLGRDIIHSPIQDQIESLHGSTEIDLLIITHCHSDHIGNLPALFTNGTLTCEWALIADPQFGYGIGGDSGPIPPVDQMSPAEKLWLALREEPIHSSDVAAIREFIEDAASQYHEYVALVEFLEEKLGSRCVRYKGPSEADSTGLDALLANFAGTGLNILGPSLRQLGNCAKFLVGRSEDVAEIAIDPALTREGRVDLVDAYRRELQAGTSVSVSVVGAVDAAEDTPENGNAVNNQSMVLTIGHGPARALLTGDMQFANPQLSDAGVREEMQALREALAADVEQNGPFGFIKLSHHGATNGQNATLLRAWGGTLYGISTGSGSSKHPTAPTLNTLKAAADSGAKWGRTDLNGRVTYRVKAGRRSLLKERGRWNDLTLPARRAGDAAPSEPAAEAPPGTTPLPPLPAPAVAPETVSAFHTESGNVEVTVKFPFGKGKVTVTIETGGEETPPLT